MPSLILMTCGTSVLSNEIANDLRGELFKYANKKCWSDIPASIADRLKLHIEKQQTRLLSSSVDQAKILSAELNSLLVWEENKEINNQNIYLLLATDTLLGEITARLIEAWLQNNGKNTVILTVTGLNTGSFGGFKESLPELTVKLIEYINSFKDKQYKIIFNLTGGFKALNGFLQALSTIYADETFYLFESSDEVLSIPKLPFKLDAEDIILNNLNIFRRIANDLHVTIEETEGITDILLQPIDKQVIFSEWGELLWRSSYKKIYAERLYPSISQRVIFADSFESTIKGLELNVLQIINERVAELAYYAENDCKKALKSVDPKPLQEKVYKKQNMWECDLDAHYRIFMQKQGYNFILQSVNKALH